MAGHLWSIKMYVGSEQHLLLSTPEAAEALLQFKLCNMLQNITGNNRVLHRSVWFCLLWHLSVCEGATRTQDWAMKASRSCPNSSRWNSYSDKSSGNESL